MAIRLLDEGFHRLWLSSLQEKMCTHIEICMWCKRGSEFLQYLLNQRKKAPTVGLEPTTTRLRALRSAD